MWLNTINNMIISLNDSYNFTSEFVPNEYMSEYKRERERESEMMSRKSDDHYPQSEPDIT